MLCLKDNMNRKASLDLGMSLAPWTLLAMATHPLRGCILPKSLLQEGQSQPSGGWLPGMQGVGELSRSQLDSGRDSEADGCGQPHRGSHSHSLAVPGPSRWLSVRWLSLALPASAFHYSNEY